MMPWFLVEEREGYGEIGNCSDITYFTYWESGPETRDSFVYQPCWQYNRSCWRVFFSNLGRKCIISEERFVLELSTSRAMLATARPCCIICIHASTKAETLVKIDSVVVEIFCEMPIFGVSSQKYKFLTFQSLALLDQSSRNLYTM